MVTWTASLETGDTAQPEDFVDLSAATATVTLTPGTTSLALALYQEVLDDELDEDDETFTVTLSDPVNARVGRELASVDPAATMTIEDDDPEPTLSVQDAAASEGEDVEFTVTLDPASGRQVTVDWATSVATGDTAGSGELHGRERHADLHGRPDGEDPHGGHHRGKRPRRRRRPSR